MLRLVLVMALAGCSPTIDDSDPATDDPTDGTDDTDSEPDPRRDPTTWPDTIGGDRPATLVTPSRYDGVTDLPVVVVLHGYTASGSFQDRYFELSQRVDVEDFVLVIPDGTRDNRGAGFWNATDVCCNFNGSTVDDSGYLLGLLDEVEAAVPIDASRITVVGHSNGGFMSYRLACDASERLAGIASLAGATFDNDADCAASEPISVLQMHGTLDATIRYGGGRFFAGGPRYPSALESVQYWADLADCGRPKDGADVDYDSLVPGAETTPQVWQECSGGVDVALWTMSGSSHIPTLTADYDEALLRWLLAQKKGE